jgi:hypothetical protein
MKTLFLSAWRILLCALTWLVGAVLGGLLAGALPLEKPNLPTAVDPRWLGLWTLVAALTLCLALAQLSRQLRGNFWTRWGLLAGVVYGVLGICNTIEACTFTSLGGGLFMAVSMLPPCVLATGLLALLFPPSPSSSTPSADTGGCFAQRGLGQWTARLLAAWLAFPLVYFIFGTPVGLLVGDLYRNESFGLRLPSFQVVIAVQLLRSFIFLLVSLPVLMACAISSRRRFPLTFGLALFAVVGLFGMLQAYWMPVGMRALHTLELLLDSLLYVWLLVKLLLPRLEGQPQPVPEPVT